MSRILILCEAAGGPVETLAAAIADGARGAGAEVQVRHIADRASAPGPGSSGVGFHRHSGTAAADELTGYDAIVIGAGTGDAGDAGRAADFLDRVADRWRDGALSGKVGSAFTAAADAGEEERVLMAIQARLMRLGLACVGLPCAPAGRPARNGFEGVEPRSAGTSAASEARDMARIDALADARVQGRHVADIANRLFPAAAMLEESEQTEHFMLGR